METRPAENRRATIDGHTAIVVERRPPIPPTLALLLEGGRGPDGRLWLPLRVARREPLRLTGARPECAQQDHRLRDWVEGFFTGSDGLARTVILLACADCGAVCVRDVSIDRLPGTTPSRLAPRRRNGIIGWYSGARPRQRVYG